MKRKISKTDFNINSLPSNRKELFYDVVKNNYRILFYIGLFLALFSFPFLFVSIYKGANASSIYELYAAGSISEEEYVSDILMNNLLFDFINCFALGILGIGLAGAMKVIKRLAYLDPVFFSSDIKEGIKDSGLHMFLIMFIVGITITINEYYLSNQSMVYFGYVSFAISLVILYPSFMIMMCALTIYNLKLFKGIATSFMLFVKTFLKSSVAYLAFISPFAILFINDLLVKYSILLVLIIFIYPIIIFGVFNYSNSFFDELINKNQYPSIYKKGLHIKDNNKNSY